jgi:type I restriction-modification system DNA methylase subunit
MILYLYSQDEGDSVTLTKEKAKENLSRMIAKFERELAAGKISEYNEEAAKIAFIQPLLKDVLGWDVNDHDEVSPEERTSRGRVDYGLKVEGKIKIYVEAKPPKVDLERHIEQAIRYGYNRKGVPFVLLTDFEALKLFDVTVKPDIRNPLKGLKLDLEYKQYLDQFDRIWQLSKESVISGKLDDLLRVRPKDRLPVDKAILEDLKRWREILAKDIFKNNQGLFHSENREKDANYLKEITQKILDRIIFMRSCEDRGLYHGDKLKAVFEERSDTVGTNTMVFLKKEFESYNIFFDSDLFRPNEWEANLAVDFNVMKEIVLGTYNPYQFDVIPLEILGNIYEQYLGYTIRLTDHQVKYELKPAVRKAGGVYYTPEYIVDYIVKNTVGKLLQELPPSKAKKLRIMDPACGSGSFLIRAYEEMLNYYQEQKTKKVISGEGEKKLELPNEKLRLKIQEKKDILINHIFGVDIDEQAVEVTKLSLMLKMLDGERGIPAGRGILPMLDKNIKCGNSLISGNPLELHKYFGEDWYKVKPFSWEDEFSQIMKEEGGFDAVIGNPPWGADFSKSEAGYIRGHYETTQGELDSYGLFIERSVKLLAKRGVYGAIVPDTWLTLINASNLRKWLLSNYAFQRLVGLNEFVFGQATVDPLILILIKLKPFKGQKVQISIVPKKMRIQDLSKLGPSSSPSQLGWLSGASAQIRLYISSDAESIINKIRSVGTPLNSLISYRAGCKPYEIGKGIPPQSSNTVKTKPFTSRNRLGPSWKPLIRGNDIQRYLARIKTPEWINYGKWLAAPRNPEIFSGPRMLIQAIRNPALPNRILAAYSNNNLISRINVYSLIKHDKTKVSYFYLLGIINSSMMNWYLKKDYGLHTYIITGVLQLPIRLMDIAIPVEKGIHDNLDLLVENIITLNKKSLKAKGSEKDQIQRQIENTDREIDDLVYKLYGITEEERRIIETEIQRQEH